MVSYRLLGEGGSVGWALVWTLAWTLVRALHCTELNLGGERFLRGMLNGQKDE